MSDAFDKFEQMLESMSLRELYLAKQLLEVDYQRRVNAKESPSRIFWISTFIQGVNLKIKEMEIQERGNKP